MARAKTAARKTARDMITFAEFQEKLQDIDVPDCEIAAYLKVAPNLATPLRPVFVPDRARVAMSDLEDRRARGAMAMNWANGVARWRREQRFLRRLRDRPGDPILVSEGDSWFQFPFFLDDVIDQLGSTYNILSTCAAGDTVKRMLGPSPDYLRSLRRMRTEKRKVVALLFSGSGNDYIDFLAGKDAEPPILNEFQPGNSDPAYYLDTNAFRAREADVTRSLTAFLEAVKNEFPGLPVLLHGYDYAIPGQKKGDWRKPAWARIDAWLAGPMAKRKITDPGLQSGIVRALIDGHNARLKQIVSGFSHAHYIDMRDVLRPRDMWADELHPTDAGFKLVADRFQDCLDDIRRGGSQ